MHSTLLVVYQVLSVAQKNVSVNFQAWLGVAGYAQVQASLELARRHAFETLERGDALSLPAKVRRYLSLQLGGYQHEIFVAQFPGSQMDKIGFKKSQVQYRRCD